MDDRLQFDVDFSRLQGALDLAIARVENTQTLMQNIGARLETNIVQRFADQVDPDGHAWLPLAASTLASKRKAGLPLTPLVALGYMKQMHVNAGPDWVEVGSAENYAVYHETGTRRMPRRSFLLGDFNAGRLGHEDEQSIRQLLDDYLNGAFGQW